MEVRGSSGEGEVSNFVTVFIKLSHSRYVLKTPNAQKPQMDKKTPPSSNNPDEILSSVI